MIIMYLIGVGVMLTASAGQIENDSYVTLCAEMDNINIPIYSTNAAAYRIVATHPHYYPTSISEWGADFSDCSFAGRGIWTIGTDNGLSTEFMQGYSFTNGDTYFPEDRPAAGVDEAAGQLPREINNDWMHDQYLCFTADESEDVNLEVRIGAKFTVKMAQVSGTLEIRARTMTTNGWQDQGTCVFDNSNLLQQWDIPDLTWIPGTDTNRIHLQVVRAHQSSYTTTNAWAYYDFLELRKRDEQGDNSANPTVLYSSSNTIVETIHIDFWWRYPEAMTVKVNGGSSDTNAHYLRIKRRMPFTSNAWNEIFVLYEDGNARIIPFPPIGLGAIPYGASVILGPTTNCPRPYASIREVDINPDDLSLDIAYRATNTGSHVELRADRDRHVVDVTEVTCDPTQTALTRFRSMWNYDGKSDIDRVSWAGGILPIMDNWTRLSGDWWQFFRETPSYHNTYCPDFLIEIMDASGAIYHAEAEHAAWFTNATVVYGCSNAFNGQALFFPGMGGRARYTDVVTTQLLHNVHAYLRYAQTGDANDIDDLANMLNIVVDGVFTSTATYAVETGGTNLYETTPAVDLGTLAAGTHTLEIIAGADDSGLALDCWYLKSRASRGWIRRNHVERQCENYDCASNCSLATRAGETTIHMAHTGTTATACYTVELTEPVSNAYLDVRYTDDVGPTRLDVNVDGQRRVCFPSESTGGWSVFSNSYVLFLGVLTAGWHDVEFISDNDTWGVDLDRFTIYSLHDNRAPIIHAVPASTAMVGSSTNFLVTVHDADQDTASITHQAGPASGDSFITNCYAWTALAENAGCTVTVLFVADDLRGLTNSITSHATRLVVPFDADNDTLDDGWEWASFTSLVYSADMDNDHDGADNRHEYIAGTHPASVTSLFAARAAPSGTNDDQYCITVPTYSGRTYTIFYADAPLHKLTHWHAFADSANGIGTWTETNAGENTFTFTDTLEADTTGSAPSGGHRVYRIGVEWNP